MCVYWFERVCDFRLRVLVRGSWFDTCRWCTTRFCAGGMFTFPLLSPALATYYKFSQTQLTTIILTYVRINSAFRTILNKYPQLHSGMISQYPLALPVGSFVDKRGPALCSLGAALLFSLGFGTIASQTVTLPVGDHASSASFFWLIFSYLCIGTSTILS